MIETVLEKIIKEYSEEIDRSFNTDEPLSSLEMFLMMQHIVAKHKVMNCFTNVTFANGMLSQGICVVNDSKHAIALVLKAEDCDLPQMHILYDEECMNFLRETQNIIFPEYPELKEDN